MVEELGGEQDRRALFERALERLIRIDHGRQETRLGVEDQHVAGRPAVTGFERRPADVCRLHAERVHLIARITPLLVELSTLPVAVARVESGRPMWKSPIKLPFRHLRGSPMETPSPTVAVPVRSRKRNIASRSACRFPGGAELPDHWATLAAPAGRSRPDVCDLTDAA